MAYYRGDYYRGDYYRGDPFLGALVGAGLKKAAGWVGSRIGRAAGSRTVRTVVEQLPGVGVGIGLEQARRSLSPSMPALGPISMAPGTSMVPYQPGGKVKRYTKDGKLIRKLNPLNPRALRRALRRAEGFEMFAKRTVNSLYKVIDGRRVRTYKKKGK